jgi:diguanylate cyclase (GGDEF)-like protein/PAS domain S-box-containing protein
MSDKRVPDFSSNLADHLALAVTTSGTGVWDRQIASGEINYSPEWKAMLGYGEDEVSCRIEDSYQRVHPDDLPIVQTAIKNHLENRTDAYVVEHRLRHKDGRYIWVLSRGRVVSRDEHGQPLRMTGVTTDITATAALSEKLRLGAELLTSLTDDIPGLVYQYLEDGAGNTKYTYASAGIMSIFGVSADTALRDCNAVEALIHPDDLTHYRASLRHSAHSLERLHVEFRVLLPGQGECWREAEARPRRLGDGGTLWHGFVSDITEHKQLEQRLLDTAATDFLTDLPNRRHIMERMEQELARVKRDAGSTLAVLMFDLDFFKAINDRHGHAVGDEVLKHFADVLRQEMRKVDSVGRFGGEEFVAILSGANMMDAGIFAERVRVRLARAPLRIGELFVQVTVSIGVTSMLASDADVTNSLSRADAALYQAKKSGRDQVRVAA